MHGVELILVSLLVAVAGLAAAARAVNVPYPIVLVVGGLLLGLAPGLPDVALQPDLVLVLFLPPLLYSAAFFANLHELRRDARSISLLAVGLVLATMCVVAVIAHALVDGLPWAAAFALGALGGVVIGLVVGWVIAEIRRRLDDVPVEITISLLSGYAAYVPAERLEASGVLAAVTVGIVVGWRAPRISTARMRLQGYAMWETLVFLLNALLL